MQWSALLPVVLTLIATQEKVSKVISNLCYTKWALEAFVIANAQRCGSLAPLISYNELKFTGILSLHTMLNLVLLSQKPARTPFAP